MAAEESTGTSSAKKNLILSIRRLSALAVLLILFSKLAVHLYAGSHYGFFRDELYYLACSHHFDWGYVDQPPLIAAIAWLVRTVLGESLAAIRLVPALAGVAEVGFAALIAGELGARRFGQALAALCVLVAPGILGTDNLFSMNAFEPLFWMGCAWILTRIIKTGNGRLWVWFGVLAGLGIENKHSMLMFGAAMVAGLLLTPQRRWLANRWMWIGGAIAFLIFLPNLLWNIQHHFPFLELQANIRHSGRDTPLGPLAFFGQEIASMNPLTLPVWLAGLWFFFGTKTGRLFRALGWAWIFTALVIVTVSPRVYYLYPAFPLLFGAGAALWDQWLERGNTWLKLAWAAAMIATGALIAPMAIPVLPPETYLRYTEALHLRQPAIETHKLGPLPQIFADQFGWREMAAAVAQVYNSLPVDVRSKTAIFGQNYGEAGAIDFFGPQYGLPPAISGHQSYFLWGPRQYTGESMIVMADRQDVLERFFASVQKVGRVEHPYSMPYEHFDVFYCRGLKQPLRDLWPRLKNWD
jgi:4-amino-4-deoxy-L-arabinose transferase-like glycosyltransferase